MVGSRRCHLGSQGVAELQVLLDRRRLWRRRKSRGPNWSIRAGGNRPGGSIAHFARSEEVASRHKEGQVQVTAWSSACMRRLDEFCTEAVSAFWALLRWLQHQKSSAIWTGH